MGDPDPHNYYADNNGYSIPHYEPKPKEETKPKPQEKAKPKVKVNHDREDHDDESIADSIIDSVVDIAFDEIFGD